MAPFEVQAKNKRICNYFIAFRGYKKCSVGHKWDIRWKRLFKETHASVRGQNIATLY